MQAQPDLCVALILWLNTIGHEKLGSKSMPKIKGSTADLRDSWPRVLCKILLDFRNQKGRENQTPTRVVVARQTLVRGRKAALYLPGFLLRILWYSQSGNHPKNHLAKFGYAQDMKVFFFKAESFYIFGYLLGTYHINVAIWKNILQNLANFKKFKWCVFKWLNF
jgi:hypothetical protein